MYTPRIYCYNTYIHLLSVIVVSKDRDHVFSIVLSILRGLRRSNLIMMMSKLCYTCMCQWTYIYIYWCDIEQAVVVENTSGYLSTCTWRFVFILREDELGYAVLITAFALFHHSIWPSFRLPATMSYFPNTSIPTSPSSGSSESTRPYAAGSSSSAPFHGAHHFTISHPTFGKTGSTGSSNRRSLIYN